jgi:hypothetical protein
MSWQYDQPGVLYDQPGAWYEGGVFGALTEWLIRARRRGRR